jgi:hypothetical protein
MGAVMRIQYLVPAALAAVMFSGAAAAAANKIAVADESKLAEHWSLVPGTQLMPPYPEAYAKDPEQVCMVVGYLVNPDGHTSDFALLKSWTSGSNSRSRNEFWAEFADLASRAVAQWRYAPKDAGSKAPVYTAATFVFGDPKAALDTQSHCAVPDLGARIVELRYDPRAHRMMSRGIFSRLDIDPMTEERIRQTMLAAREAGDEKGMAAADAIRDAPAPSSSDSSGSSGGN